MYKSVGRILNWTGSRRKRIYLGFVCSFLASLCAAGPVMVATWALGLVVQDMSGKIMLDSLLVWKCLGYIFIMILLRYLFSLWKAKLQESVGYEVAAEQRIKIGDILKRVSMGCFSDNSVGDLLASITTELSTLELQGMKMIDSVVNGYLQAAAVICCMAFFCPPAALISTIGVILSAFALGGICRQSKHTAPITHKAQEDLSGAVIEYARGLPIVKSFGQEGVSFSNFRKACLKNKRICIKNEFGFVSWNCLHLFFLKGASVTLVLTAAWETINGRMELPVLLMASMFSFIIYESVESINNAAHVLSVINSAMDKLENIECAQFIDSDGTDVPLNRFDVNFEHVFFGYGKSTILHDISFKLPQNTTTAMVGPSGSGKSTICNLIARFYDTDSGTVSVGGHNVREFTCNSLMKNISMVFQNVYLFHDTILNNIRFGKPDASYDEVIAAAKAAQCHDFIMNLPDGYNTLVGETGATLSGGEKQRISIARSILKDAPIIILDEATASVDPENEHKIQQAISALVHGKTIIIIAHRLATIRSADQILVIDEGRIIQRGTHEELISHEGIYRKFLSIREVAEGWSI